LYPLTTPPSLAIREFLTKNKRILEMEKIKQYQCTPYLELEVDHRKEERLRKAKASVKPFFRITSEEI